jgi:non-ribosomal peptide synthetase component F
MIMYRHTRFILSCDSVFALLDCEEYTGVSPPAGGLSPSVAAERLELFGRNAIDVPMPPWYVLLAREASNPFTAFQIWAIAVWVSEEYYTFSAFIFVTVSAMLLSVCQQWRARTAAYPLDSLAGCRVYIHGLL